MKHYLPETRKPLLGKKILSVHHSDNESSATIEFEGLSLRISVEGDCCSHSVFYGVNVDPGAIGSRLISVEDGCEVYPEIDAVEAANKAFGHEGDCLKLWDIVLKTEGGDVRLHHINDSNGYYDGMTSYDINYPG